MSDKSDKTFVALFADRKRYVGPAVPDAPDVALLPAVAADEVTDAGTMATGDRYCLVWGAAGALTAAPITRVLVAEEADTHGRRHVAVRIAVRGFDSDADPEPCDAQRAEEITGMLARAGEPDDNWIAAAQQALEPVEGFTDHVARLVDPGLPSPPDPDPTWGGPWNPPIRWPR